MSTRRNLTREAVVAVAVELLNQQAPAGELGLSSLAAALQVRPPSLYNHIQGLEDLQGAITLRELHRLHERLQSSLQGAVGKPALEKLAHAYRGYALENPGVYAYTLKAPAPGEVEIESASQALIQLMLLVLASCGLQGEDALHAIRGLRSLLHGFVSLEMAGGFGMPLSRDESFRRLLQTYLSSLGT